MERMDKGDLLHIGAAYVGVHTFKGKDYVTVRDFSTTTNALSKEILELEEENKKLKSEIKELNADLEHRDSFFSIMRDVLANETITNSEIAMITYCVVHDECGDYDLSKKELEVVKKFWNREYV